jgi:hypothetical protein
MNGIASSAQSIALESRRRRDRAKSDHYLHIKRMFELLSQEPNTERVASVDGRRFFVESLAGPPRPGAQVSARAALKIGLVIVA